MSTPPHCRREASSWSIGCPRARVPVKRGIVRARAQAGAPIVRSLGGGHAGRQVTVTGCAALGTPLSRWWGAGRSGAARGCEVMLNRSATVNGRPARSRSATFRPAYLQNWIVWWPIVDCWCFPRPIRDAPGRSFPRRPSAADLNRLNEGDLRPCRVRRNARSVRQLVKRDHAGRRRRPDHHLALAGRLAQTSRARRP